MKCAAAGCSHKATRECAECSRRFCEEHAALCDWCEAYVCYECRDEHESSPQHEEASRNV